MLTELFGLLGKLYIVVKDMRIIQNIYWQQSTCIRTENEFSKNTKIEMVVRQGSVFSPDVFSLKSEGILREFENLVGFIIGSHTFKSIW